MANERIQEIIVIDRKGQRGTVYIVPNPSQSVDAESQFVYGMDGLTVDKISEREFRDFRGTIWTEDTAKVSRVR